ncbi:MAG: AAA family ATPase, partial [Gammaproteobacteria bacterium]
MGPAMMGAAPELMTSKNEESPAARRYRINLIVAHKPDGGAPIVFEDDPSHARLVGRIEHRAEFGALSTDFSLIRGGALHRANGGYLVIDAMRLLAEPFAWQALKQSLIRRSIRVESLSDRYSFASTQTLEPEPIPLNIKVILIGEPRHYYLLKAYDADFSRLFKVAADFEDTFDRTDSAVSDFCRTVA